MITIKDISRRAGVSIGTVDRVLHNRGRVSRTTAHRVLHIVKKLGYTTNVFARHLSLSRQFTFGVIMPKLNQDSAYWKLLAKGIDRATRELSASRIRTVYFLYDKYSRQSFVTQTKALSATPIDGVIIAAGFTNLAKEFMDGFHTKVSLPVPCVSLDSEIPGVSSLTSIYQDSFQSGVVAAKLMCMSLNKKGCIAVIRVFPESFHINERARGFESFIRRFPYLKICIYDMSDNRKSTFKTLTERILKDNPDLLGIFVANANTHYVAEFLENRVRPGKVMLIGYDLVEKNRRYLERNIIDYIISQQPEVQGYTGVYSLYRHLILKQPCKKNVLMPIDIITKENCAYYHPEV
jgi:LacI family transcriptional regulator